jgi:hypothetical protein
MPIAIVAEKNSLANKYAADAPNGALFTADPGTTGTATGEVNGGSPAYARLALNWGAAANGVVTGPGSAFNVPSGATPSFFAVCVSATAGTADLRDKNAITAQTFSSQGTLTITPTYTQT